MLASVYACCQEAAARLLDSKGGKNRQGKHQARIRQRSHAMPGGHLPMDAGHPGKTEAQTEASAGLFKAVPHPAVRGEG